MNIVIKDSTFLATQQHKLPSAWTTLAVSSFITSQDNYQLWYIKRANSFSAIIAKVST